MPVAGSWARPRFEPGQQRTGVDGVPAFDGGLGEVDHNREPELIEGQLEAGFFREFREQFGGPVSPTPFDVRLGQDGDEEGARDVRCLRGHLLDERGELALGPPLAAHDIELRAEDGGGIGLSAFGADLERLRGVLFGQVGIPRDLGPKRADERVSPGEHGLVQSLRHRTVDGDAAVHLLDVPDQKHGPEARACAPGNSNTGSPRRSARTRRVGCTGQGLLEQ